MIQFDDDQEIIEPSQSLNHLFVLKLAEEENYEMEQVGSVLNLAPGERVQSARFVGKRVLCRHFPASGSTIHF